MPSTRVCPDCGRHVSCDEASPSARSTDDSRSNLPSTRAPVRYCPFCAQRLDAHGLRIADLVHETLGAIFTLELPLIRTAIDAAVDPGTVARKWIRGMRRRYANPLKLLVVIGLVVAVLHPVLQDIGKARTPMGTAYFEIGLLPLAMRWGPLCFVVIALPVALVMAVLMKTKKFDARSTNERAPGFSIGLPSESWLSWYVVALFAYAIAAGIQLPLMVLGAFAPVGPWRTSAYVAQGALPILLYTRAAAGFVGTPFRARAIASALGSQFLVILGVTFVAWLFEDR
ncbi:MAG: DUF3667 domain-containing protein [Planctomycetes bacterium]|nr:DUF3667 domain-containing protein [Planctomycetota bacterium]